MPDHDERMTESDPDDPPGLVLRAFDSEGRYVLGFPVHVALTVCADHPRTHMRQLPLASWVGNAGAIGIRLVDRDTETEVVKVEPWPVVLPELGTSTFSLLPGTCRRMLVDVSPYLQPGLKPGQYDLTTIYSAPPERVESQAVPIELVAPGGADRKELDRLRPELALAGSWGRWTNLPPHGEPAAPPRGSRDPLRFNRILRYLMYGPEELSEVNPARIDVLHGVYEPESHALLAELYWARGDAERFTENATIVRTSYAGLAWWIDAIEAGRSAIAFVRASRMRASGG
jgi:hypothetical protein